MLKLTYEEIMAKLNDGERRAVADALDEEAGCLLANQFKFKGRREGPKARAEREAHALADARSYFAEDVSQFLAGERTLTPIVVLNHRHRVAVAWAVSEILRPKVDTRRYTLDGMPIDLAYFLKENDGALDEVDHARIECLTPGSSVDLGGGASPIITLTRIA